MLAFNWSNAIDVIEHKYIFRCPREVAVFDLRQGSFVTSEYSNTVRFTSLIISLIIRVAFISTSILLEQEEVQFKFSVSAGISGTLLMFGVEAKLRFETQLTKTTTRSVRDTDINVFHNYATISAGSTPMLDPAFEVCQT